MRQLRPLSFTISAPRKSARRRAVVWLVPLREREENDSNRRFSGNVGRGGGGWVAEFAMGGIQRRNRVFVLAGSRKRLEGAVGSRQETRQCRSPASSQNVRESKVNSFWGECSAVANKGNVYPDYRPPSVRRKTSTPMMPTPSTRPRATDLRYLSYALSVCRKDRGGEMVAGNGELTAVIRQNAFHIYDIYGFSCHAP